MRLAFLILVFCNLAFFVWGQGYLGTRDNGREPQRLTNTLQPEKIQLVAKPAAGTRACRLISGLTAADAETLTVTLSTVKDWELVVTTSPVKLEHWVLIPGLPSNPVAEKKLSEVRLFGFADARIIEDETNGPFVISLGVFRNQQGAQEFFDAASKKGIRSAKLLERKPPASVSAELRAPVAELNKRLEDVLAPYPAASTADCPVS